ncbi:hypothetical protein Runsl_3488 [Runella slithyformis DSM 19594]|uniref:Uncharacterized protein n=1 Tax=Runella slithyformis (strain ATCC 29530 / DSM 19594 / LMG 11500 / NCIMB 11436 / LSU 4) TaxID=761193 RepID=A0A7U3ZMC6_RUNSL|nr:hypothetical protein Runsl_3488 [Runella slithyformis DSM 19594]
MYCFFGKLKNRPNGTEEHSGHLGACLIKNSVNYTLNFLFLTN